ncbi:Lsr2 family protein [Glycomyces sp. A-F 0318]|uniref:Lsr2 dimerization domain-containing protein n=1 Tax=Glycomyces amatae TaxID=2881355 RepID=UPI001E559CC3|nr:histone-like nucleoid-structuring protein Lsr2 [Glycomyces amatae]MCD0446269.1 Lsr2 family protein [Glycomyces amatae]
MSPFKDDLDGREADLAITFGIDGVLYRIRLSVEHAADLGDLLGPLRDHARQMGLVHLAEPEVMLPEVEFVSRRAYWAAIRDWAAVRGIDLPANRQPPHEVTAAFDLERALEQRDRNDMDRALGP